ncbi:M48 family metallopeptidase [Actinocrispum wychmicini]|uniref:Zn-dependent protease with chaperone function n=1 Tax=Actinocrispum wychmicini TaxID=1213861 RepID=A0A4V2S760_9PSEU|nr:M48 family metallopeptidase [Actinocrispum wychmicini]TCO58670.1 Zn-dependent protease with chaperone function [Actinocrispum wychmicini]
MTETAGGRWVSRLARRMGHRLDLAFFTENVGKPLSRPGWSVARVGLLVVSLVLFAVVLGCVGLGLWWVVADFPSWLLVPGLLMMLLGWALLPRLGRVDEWGAVAPADAPRLRALVDSVCAAVECAVPDVVIVDSRFNASAGVVGWRRRKVLRIGLPLWGALEPAERVALLGHEVGHFVNNDPIRGLLTRPALTVFGPLAEAVRPHPDMANAGYALDFVIKAVLIVVSPVLWAVSWALSAIHLGLLAVASRDHQRAEYAADVLAARVAGTDGVVGLVDTLVMGESIVMAIRGAELSAEPGAASWRVAATRVRQGADVKVARQVSVREDASLWSSHPPAGYRARMIEALPAHEALVTLSEEDLAAIDREVAAWYKRAGRDIST